MPLEIAVKQGQQLIKSMGSFDDLEDALTEFNELINLRNWHQSVTTISLTDTDKNKCLAQYALQEFNYSENQPHKESQPHPDEKNLECNKSKNFSMNGKLLVIGIGSLFLLFFVAESWLMRGLPH